MDEDIKKLPLDNLSSVEEYLKNKNREMKIAEKKFLSPNVYDGQSVRNAMETRPMTPFENFLVK